MASVKGGGDKTINLLCNEYPCMFSTVRAREGTHVWRYPPQYTHVYLSQLVAWQLTVFYIHHAWLIHL